MRISPLSLAYLCWTTTSTAAFVYESRLSLPSFQRGRILAAANGQESSSNRRKFLLVSGGTLPLLAFSDKVSAVDTSQPLADLPMIRLKLPKQAVGREYVVVKLKINGEGPFDFMVDSGQTTELITPHLQQSLHLQEGRGTRQGLAAGGGTGTSNLLTLSGASLCCGEFAGQPKGAELKLPPLSAIVADFPQEHIDPAHDPVEGMLGQEMLMLFDVDFDFPNGRLRLWAPGTVAAQAAKAGLVEVPAAILNETLLLGMRVTSPQAGPQAQPIIGFLDCGATFSAVNWAGAKLLGLPPKENADAYKGGPLSAAIGVDGKPLYLPLKKMQFTFVGDPDPSGRAAFVPPPPSWKPWDPVNVGIGDLPVFSQALGDGRTPYMGPAALIGLDVLSQRRVIMETGKSGRRRRLFISPS